MTGPLDGLRVVNLSNTLTGVQVGQFLADTGAEVLHVEPPGGSGLRSQRAHPAWAQHTDALLEEFGYSTAEVADLRERNVVA